MQAHMNMNAQERHAYAAKNYSGHNLIKHTSAFSPINPSLFILTPAEKKTYCLEGHPK